MAANYFDPQVRVRARACAPLLGEPTATEMCAALDAIDHLQSRLLLARRVIDAAQALQEEVRVSEVGPAPSRELYEAIAMFDLSVNPSQP